MKANRKFLARDDEAVSPVIAVILMVAITVVLAATVYVWVSGFGGSGQAAKSLSLTGTKESSIYTYTVAQATQGMRWQDLKFNVAGVTTAYQLSISDGDCYSAHGAITSWTPGDGTAGSSCSATALASTVDAGDQIYLMDGSTTALSGVELTVLDASANSIMLNQEGARTDAGSGTDPDITSAVRRSGTAGNFQTAGGVTRFTLDRPIDLSTLVVADVTTVSGNSLGSATLTIRSPTVFDIAWSGGAVVTGDTIRLVAGVIDDQTSTATAATADIVLTAAM